MTQRTARPGTTEQARRRLAVVTAVLLCTPTLHFGAAAAAPVPNPCGNSIAILNESEALRAFDRDNGGGDRRLRFRLDGSEAGPPEANQPPPKPDRKAEAPVAADATRPDNAGDGKSDARSDTRPDAGSDTKAETKAPSRLDIVAKGAAGEQIIATIDLKGRSASYCFLGASRVDMKPDHRTGCPGTFLRNFLQIRLVDSDGPFVRRDVDIEYLYRPDAVTTSLDRCSPPRVLDGMFRRRAWTVTLDGGAAVRIGETAFPRDRRATVPADAPSAITVTGQ